MNFGSMGSVNCSTLCKTQSRVSLPTPLAAAPTRISLSTLSGLSTAKYSAMKEPIECPASVAFGIFSVSMKATTSPAKSGIA